MADIRVEEGEEAPQSEASIGELIFWVIGVLMIPLVPILMTVFFTPWSGM